MAYVFRDLKLGELGRLAVEGTTTGKAHMIREVAGFPFDPITRRRDHRIERLCMDLMRVLEPMGGNGRSASLSIRASQPVGQALCEAVRAIQGTRVNFRSATTVQSLKYGLVTDSSRKYASRKCAFLMDLTKFWQTIT